MKRINVISWAVLSLVAATIMSSCNKQEEEFLKLDGRYVYLSIDAESGVDTKASNSLQKAETFEISDNGTSIFITASKSVNNDNPFNRELITKGAEKTVADVSEGFTMRMFADADNALYKVGTVKQQSSDGTYWSFWDGQDKVVWPDDAENGAPYSFVSVIGAENMTFANFAAKTVDYTGMVHADGGVNDSELMEDLIVAYTKGVVHDHAAQNPVNLRFYHPLAAVKFFVSPKVKAITVTNVRQGGKLEYRAVDPNSADDFKNAFVWTSSADESNITAYTQAVKTSDVDETGYATYEFFLIPQQFDSQDVMLTFTVEATDGKVHQISTLANNLGTGSWDAGYRYNYYIDETASGNVGLQIKENFQNYVKTNVTVFNTKRSTAYVRATVVANWESESGKIIAPFSTSNINFNVGAGSNWVLGDDGYYYYTKPVVGFTYTDPLISSFSDTSTAAELNFKLRKYRLVWRIIAQGVEFDQEKHYVGEAWSSITVDGQSLVENILETE